MQNSSRKNSGRKPGKKRETYARRFTVGIVGASDSAFAVISRIFQVTAYRTRCYQPVKINSQEFNARSQVEFLLMCSTNDGVISAWERRPGADAELPMIFLQKPGAPARGRYHLEVPVNPSRLIKLLDHYTIKELNFFPEFEIGNESGELGDIAVSGLQMLRSSQKNGAKNGKEANGDGARGKALVVDDSLAVRRQMQIEFELRDVDLDVAANADQAMDAIKQAKYDIVFLDVVMPGVDGYTVCKQIKRCPLNKETPVVMLTSRSGSFDKIKGTLAGCDSYLVKPINHNEFEAVYSKHMNKVHHNGKAGERAHVG